MGARGFFPPALFLTDLGRFLGDFAQIRTRSSILQIVKGAWLDFGKMHYTGVKVLPDGHNKSLKKSQNPISAVYLQILINFAPEAPCCKS